MRRMSENEPFAVADRAAFGPVSETSAAGRELHLSVDITAGQCLSGAVADLAGFAAGAPATVAPAFDFQFWFAGGALSEYIHGSWARAMSPLLRPLPGANLAYFHEFVTWPRKTPGFGQKNTPGKPGVFSVREWWLEELTLLPALAAPARGRRIAAHPSGAPEAGWICGLLPLLRRSGLRDPRG